VLIEQNMSQADQLAEAATRQAVREQAHLADLAALQAELEAREVALAEAEDARAQLENSLSETQSALRQRQHEADETAAALKATRQQLQEAETGLAEMRKAQGEARASLEALRRKAENDGAARYDEIAELTRTLIEREAHLAAQATRLHSVNAAYAEVNNTAERLRQEIAAQEVAVTNLRAEIDRRGAAIGHLMGLAEEGRRLSDRIGQAIDALLRQAERPWLRGRRQLARKAALLRASGLFDAEWYGAAHPDVTAAGQDPATHFILFGRAEGRHPLPDLARFLAGLPANPASRTEEPGSAP
jgi:chromosome segregation ATPase